MANGSPTTRPGNGVSHDSLGFVQPVAGHQHARQRRARLAGVEECLADAVGSRLGEVGFVEVVEQDVGGLAAELQRDPLDGLGTKLGHPAAGAGGTGERDHVDIRMGSDCLADDGPEAGHEVEHPCRQPDLVDDLGEDERVDRGDLAGLQHDRASRSQCVGEPLRRSDGAGSSTG